MRIVKTKRTIGMKKWIGKMYWDGRNKTSVMRQLKDEYGENIICLQTPQTKERMGTLQIYKDDPLP